MLFEINKNTKKQMIYISLFQYVNKCKKDISLHKLGETKIEFIIINCKIAQT